jgi:hypothetical protein
MRFFRNRTLAFLVISSALILATGGCKKSNNGSSGSMTASRNDTTWTANSGASGVYTQAANEFQVVGIQFKSGDSTIFYLTFYTPFTVNQAISSDTASVDIEYVDNKSGLFYDGGSIAGHSQLTITNYDLNNLKIGGTFSGVLYNVVLNTDSLVITNGTFSAPFALQ